MSNRQMPKTPALRKDTIARFEEAFEEQEKPFSD